MNSNEARTGDRHPTKRLRLAPNNDGVLIVALTVAADTPRKAAGRPSRQTVVIAAIARAPRSSERGANICGNTIARGSGQSELSSSLAGFSSPFFSP